MKAWISISNDELTYQVGANPPGVSRVPEWSLADSIDISLKGKGAIKNSTNITSWSSWNYTLFANHTFSNVGMLWMF